MKTSWNKEAKWYDEHLRTEGEMHRQVVIPGVFKMLDPKKGEHVLDIACGQGQLAYDIANRGALVTGIDAAPSLIELAKKRVPKGKFYTADAKRMAPLKDEEFHAASCVLALQNIDDIGPVMLELARVLKKGGRAVLVINHPSFRIPRQTSWGWDETKKMQYRRIDAYLSEARIPIEMHPGKKEKSVTWTFHRPLSAYVNALGKAGLAVDAMEEWVSPKVSTFGPKAKAENRARAEFPLFLAMKLKRL